MFSNNSFYFQSIRKVVTAFGTLFNDITITRDDGAGTIKVIDVPLSFAPREQYIAKLKGRPESQYPRMSYELTGMLYDSARKLVTTGYRKAETSSAGLMYKQLNPVPYNFSFDLNVFSGTIEDGLQIIEQILPYFTPDITLTIKEITTLDIDRDVPFYLESVTQSDNWESLLEDERKISWTLSFTAKGYIYPPFKEGKIIREVISNIGKEPGLIDETVTVTIDPLTAKESEVWSAVTTIT